MKYKEKLKIKLTPDHDGRRKIPKEMHEVIRKHYESLQSTRKLAGIYGCSRRLIMFILHPERLLELQKRNIENKHHLKYYNREKQTDAIRKFRRLKINKINSKLNLD